MSFIGRIWQSDMPEIPERHRWLADFFMLTFAVSYPVMLLATYHYIFLGPVLGEDTSFAYVLSFLDFARGSGERLGVGTLLFWLLALAILGTVCLRGVVIHRAYRAHRAAFGRALPLDQLVTYVSTNLLNLAYAPLVLLLLAGLAHAAGYSWRDGWNAMTSLREFAEHCVAQVPTLVVLPRPLAFLVMFMAATFVHYWAHRWSHVQRFMWLVIHRLHHITEDISPVTTLPSILSFPIVFALMVPYLFIFGALSKLVYPEPLFYEMITVMVVMMVAEIYNHSASLYDAAAKTRWLRWLGFIMFGQAAYHVLHHASDRDPRFKKVAYTSNIGPGPFCCWDLLFGTYRELPDTAPPTGLTDLPRLVKNPLRLLLSGIAQIAYELYWNKSWRTRFWILVGSVNYHPPISKDFALAEDVHKRAGSTEVSPHVMQERSAT